MIKPGTSKASCNNNDNKSMKTHDGSNEYYNLLFLGPSGVGKSTFINAFVNYLMYDTLGKARNAHPVVLIKSKFLITDENFVEKVISVSAGNNTTDESDVLGDSATQETKIYTFPILGKKKVLRLIDTPGIGDTRGIDQDELNCDDIFQRISRYDKIHAICFLLKPNDARVTAEFEFCIKELLSRLDKSATDNIVFIFTNSRASLYRPGDTLPALQRLLQDIKEQPPYAEIPLRKENIFCMDNEAFRFLMAMREVKFDAEAVAELEKSWNVSREVCLRLVNYIMGDNNNAGLKPHITENTVSINNVRRLIMQLAQLLVDISKLIGNNQYALEQQVKKLEREKQSLNLLKSNMFTPNVNVAYEIANREADIKKLEIKIQQMESFKKEHEEEHDIILNYLYIFAWFLKNNAITAHNDAYHTYVGYLIDREKSRGDKVEQFAINHFQTVLQRYEEYKKILNTATAQFEAIDVKAATVAVLISKLFSLKNHGMKIKNLYEGQNRSHNVEIKNYEYVHPTILSLNAEASTPQTNRKTPSSKTPQKGQNQSQVEDNQPQNSSIKRRRRRTPRKPRNKCSSPLENENHLPGPPPPHLQPSPHFQRQPSPYFQGSPLLHAQKQSPRPPPPVHFGPPPQQFRAPQPNFPLPPPHFQLPPPPRHYKQYSVPNYQNFPPTSSFNLPYQDGRSQIQGGCFQHNQQHTQQQWSPGPSKGNNLSSNAAAFTDSSKKPSVEAPTGVYKPKPKQNSVQSLEQRVLFMKVQASTGNTTTPDANKKETKTPKSRNRKNEGQENDCNCQTPNTNRTRTRRNRRRKRKEKQENNCNLQLQERNSDKSDSNDDADSSFDANSPTEAQQDVVPVFTQEFVKEAISTAIASLQLSPQQSNNKSPMHTNLEETQQHDYNLQPKGESSDNNGTIGDDICKEASEAEMCTSEVGQVEDAEHLQPSSEQRNNQSNSSDKSTTIPKTEKALSFFRKLFG